MWFILLLLKNISLRLCFILQTIYFCNNSNHQQFSIHAMNLLIKIYFNFNNLESKKQKKKLTLTWNRSGADSQTGHMPFNSKNNLYGLI